MEHVTDAERHVAEVWQCLADACLEHDQVHEQRALRELQRLVPEQRQPPAVPVQAAVCCSCGFTWWWPTTGVRPATCPDCPSDAASVPASWRLARMRTALHHIAAAADRADLATVRELVREALA